MRWILPLLSLALAPLAHGDIAVYIGNATTQQSGGSASSIQSSRAIQVIDLATGKYRAVVFNGSPRNNSFTVSDEAQYTIAKTADRRLQTSTSFAEAGTGANSDQSTQVSSTLLQGRDSGVFLRPEVKTQWPRLIAGAGFDLVTAGVGAADQPTPALVSKSFFTLTLDATESQTANAGTETLQAIANRVAQSLVQAAIARHEAANTRPGPFVSGGSGVVIKTGSGTITFTPGPISGGTLTIGGGGVIKTGAGAIDLSGVTFSGGALNIGSGSTLPIVSGTTGGTLTLSGSDLYGGSTTVSGGTLNLGNNTFNSVSGGATLNVSGAGMLTTAGGVNSSGVTLSITPGSTFTLGGSLAPIHLPPGATVSIYGHEYSGGTTGATLTLPPGTTTPGPDTIYVLTPNP